MKIRIGPLTLDTAPGPAEADPEAKLEADVLRGAAAILEDEAATIDRIGDDPDDAALMRRLAKELREAVDRTWTAP